MLDLVSVDLWGPFTSSIWGLFCTSHLLFGGLYNSIQSSKLICFDHVKKIDRSSFRNIFFLNTNTTNSSTYISIYWEGPFGTEGVYVDCWWWWWHHTSPPESLVRGWVGQRLLWCNIPSGALIICISHSFSSVFPKVNHPYFSQFILSISPVYHLSPIQWVGVTGAIVVVG